MEVALDQQLEQLQAQFARDSERLAAQLQAARDDVAAQ